MSNPEAKAGRTWLRLASAASAVVLGSAAIAAVAFTQMARAATTCSVSYGLSTDWGTGFTAAITIENVGSPITSWTLQYTYPGNQQLSSGWNGNWSQSGETVTVTNASYNGSLGTSASVQIGANFSYSGSNTSPSAFTLNGAACSATAPSPSPTATSPSPSPSPTATSPSPSPSPSPTTAPPSGMQGYASLSGDGHGPTTGGAGGPTVTVTSLSALETAAASSGPEIIRVNGMFSGSGEVKVASNKTIIGVGANSGLTGIGLSMQGKSGANIFNVIVQNMNISFVTASSGDGDAIHIQYADHIWVDHNNLFSDMSHGKDFYDGLVDITHASDFVTVSWNNIHDHFKVSLVGDSDNNGAEDTGHLHVTYYDNYFHNFDSRTPSLRFGTGHVFNNYFVNGSTGVDSREGAQMLVENNVFVNVGTPIETCCESNVDGFVNQSGNDFGTGTNNITQTGTFTNPPYSFTLIPTSQVASTVTAGAGTGKISA
jgi:pectate lyase